MLLNMNTTAWRDSIGPIIATLVANLVVMVLVSFNTKPLAISFAATGVFLFVQYWFDLKSKNEYKDDRLKLSFVLMSNLIIVAVVALGVWLSSMLNGNLSVFYSLPAMPIRIDIALFGSFFVGLSSLHFQTAFKPKLPYFFVLASLFWIAPCYGYFSAPIFLGMNILHFGDHMTATHIALTLFGIFAGDQLGRKVAYWLKAAPKK